MGNKVERKMPSLNRLVLPDSSVTDLSTGNRQTMADLEGTVTTPWASDAIKAYEESDTGRGTIKMARALADMAVSRLSEKDNGKRKALTNAYGNVYLGVNNETTRQGISATPAFASAVMLDIVPELLNLNAITESPRAKGNLSDRVISTVTALLRGEEVRDNGGSIRIFSQMCAHYDSGENHSQDSFTGGLTAKLDQQKINQALTPMKHVAATLGRFGVPVEIITPQVTPHPEIMLAMVPATVWGYIEQGKVVDMLNLINDHSQIWPQMASEALGERPNLRYRAPSLAKADEQQPSIIEETLRLTKLFSNVRELASGTKYQNGSLLAGWSDLAPEEVKKLMFDIDWFRGGEEALFKQLRATKQWTDHEQNMFRLMRRTLMAEGWGTLEDTRKFYAREVLRRSDDAAENWRRTVNIQSEVNVLLANKTFHPHLSPDRRAQEAAKLLDWVNAISNIGIGSRAIFNTALYASLAEHLVSLQSKKDVAIMWPLEEDIDSWALEIMTSVFEEHSQNNQSIKHPAIPCVYPRKEFRQPFGAFYPPNDN